MFKANERGLRALEKQREIEWNGLNCLNPKLLVNASDVIAQRALVHVERVKRKQENQAEIV